MSLGIRQRRVLKKMNRDGGGTNTAAVGNTVCSSISQAKEVLLSLRNRGLVEHKGMGEFKLTEDGYNKVEKIKEEEK